MPSKSRSYPLTIYRTGTGPPDQEIIGVPDYAYTGQEKIEYENGRSRINRCSQNRIKVNPTPFNGVLSRTGSSETKLKFLNHMYNLPQNLLGGGSISPPDLDAILSSKASNATGFNAINFLLELDDIPKLFGKIKNIQDLILRYNLGFLPLKSDLESLLLSINSLKATLHNTSFGRMSLGKVTASRTSSYIYTSRPLPHTFLRMRGRIISRVGGEASLTTPDLGQYRQLANLLDAFGVYPDAYTFWNAIPFSFVVDYFINVGKILESLRSGWVDPVLTLDGGWQWIKDTGEASYFWDEPDYWNEAKMIPMATCEYKFFNRGPLYTVQRPLPQLRIKLPYFSQGLNLVALLTQ